ncbi:MAG: hypothetical protein WB608_16585 [Terracidiphilus sp.]
MNTPTEKAAVRVRTHGGEAEKTLQLIASLPPPEGLEDRVNSALRAATMQGRVLHWPDGLRSGGGWTHSAMARCAAAAAIVVVVAGGGWDVYSRIQPVQEPRAIAIPHVSGAAGGFSNAGAMRTPQTLSGPILSHPIAVTAKATHANAKRDAHAFQRPRKKGSINQSQKLAK